MVEKKPFAKLKWTTIVAIKTGLFGLGLTLGVQYGPDITAAWHGITHGHQPAAQQFHHDGYRVQIENETTDKGEIQTYVTYNNKKIEVYDDLLPSNQTMLLTLSDRVNKATPDELESLDAKTQQLQNSIDKKRGLPLEYEVNAIRRYGEGNPQLFNQMGPNFKLYALEKLYNQLQNEVGGGEKNGK